MASHRQFTNTFFAVCRIYSNNILNANIFLQDLGKYSCGFEGFTKAMWVIDSLMLLQEPINLPPASVILLDFLSPEHADFWFSLRFLGLTWLLSVFFFVSVIFGSRSWLTRTVVFFNFSTNFPFEFFAYILSNFPRNFFF